MTMRIHEESGGARKIQEEPGEARMSQEEPSGTMRSQEGLAMRPGTMPGSARPGRLLGSTMFPSQRQLVSALGPLRW